MRNELTHQFFFYFYSLALLFIHRRFGDCIRLMKTKRFLVGGNGKKCVISNRNRTQEGEGIIINLFVLRTLFVVVVVVSLWNPFGAGRFFSVVCSFNRTLRSAN